MKKLFSVLLALVLVLSFSLVTAAPAGAAQTERLKLTFATAGEGIAEWSAKQHIGDYSIHLAAPGKCDWSLPDPGLAEADIQIPLAGTPLEGLTLNELEMLSWWNYLVNGYPSALRIKLDADGDGDDDYHLVGEFAYQQWDESGFVYTGTAWVPYTHYKSGLEGGDTFYYPTYDTWMQTFHTTDNVSATRPDDTEATHTIHDATIFWTYVVGGTYGVDWCSCPMTGYPAEASYFARLQDYKTTEVSNIKGDKTLPVLGDAEVLMLEFAITNEIGPFVDPPGHEVYFDELTINDVTYELEPRVINSRTGDGFNTIQDAIDAAGPGDTILVYPGIYIDDENGDGDDLDPGEGGLVADIYELEDRSGLTLKSTDGPEVTILISRGKEGDGVIRICGPDVEHPATGVTIDGFTVINTGEHNAGMGILIGARFAGDMERPASNNIVRNCIVDGCTQGIYLWHTDNNTIEKNEVINTRAPSGWEGTGIKIWGGWGPDQNAPSRNNVIRDNFVSKCASHGRDSYGIFVASLIGPLDLDGQPIPSGVQVDFAGTVISGNTVIESGRAGIGIEYATGPITVSYNNITGNAAGVVVIEADMVDATNNWWGNASGPADEVAYENTGYEGYGDKVSGNVSFEPWLLEEVDIEKVAIGILPTTYDKTLALRDGWTLISTDKLVAATGSTWVGTEDLGAEKTVLAYEYTGASYPVVELPDGLEPIDALYVKTAGGGGVGINYSASAPGVSSKDLVAGWNLISSGTIAKTNAVLSPLRDIAMEGTGLTTLVSQGSYNQHTGGWYLDATDWGNLSGKMNPFDGYWIYMNAAKSFGVPSD